MAWVGCRRGRSGSQHVTKRNDSMSMASCHTAWALICSLFTCATSDLDFVPYDYTYTDPDGKNPEIISTFPANGSRGASLNTTIEFTLSEHFFFGDGTVYLWSPTDVRKIHATDTQISRKSLWEDTVVLRLVEVLKPATAYTVEVRAAFVTDLIGNKYRGGRFSFRTVGEPPRFLAFAPYVQTPNSPVVFSFRTGWLALYGSTGDYYALQLWPAMEDTFYVATSGAESMQQRCAIVVEISSNFPPIEECGVRDGRFEITLRAPLHSEQEYSLVVLWPVRAQSSTSGVYLPTEEYWELAVWRWYEGIMIEVERFPQCRHRFENFLFNNIDNRYKDALLSFTMIPTIRSAQTEWLGPGTTREFQVDLKFGDPGLGRGDRLIFVASPLTFWTTNPARPSNLTVLNMLLYWDPLLLSDPTRRAAVCPHFFPADLPPTTECRLLELGLGTYTYGFELRLPRRGPYVQTVVNESRSFMLTLPGVVQPLALMSRWEVILAKAVAPGEAGAVERHGLRRVSMNHTVLNTSAGMDFRVLSSSHPYPEPVGTRVSHVQIELATGVFALGSVDVAVELLEPSLARIERCDVLEGQPRLIARRPVITNQPTSLVRWQLISANEGDGVQSYVAYPWVRYRSVCLVYNGARTAPSSIWRLSVTASSTNGEQVAIAKEYTSRTYFVTATMAAGQVLPTLPLAGRKQIILVRFTLPANDGVTLHHWTSEARRLTLQAPLGFRVSEGPCLGFRPLTSSSLPPMPLSKCSAAYLNSQAILDVSISEHEAAFQPGYAYAFRAVLENPAWDEVESRVVGKVEIPKANQWVLSLFAEDMLVVIMEDVPPTLSIETAALRPESLPEGDNTAFRVFQRRLHVQAITAADPRVGHTTTVILKLDFSTPFAFSDLMQITAPSIFVFLGVSSDASVGDANRLDLREHKILESAPWIMLVGVFGTVEPSKIYGLALEVRNPTAWTSLDDEFNFWFFETYYRPSGLLDKRSRRDVGVKKGYRPSGALLDCLVQPFSRTLSEETWVSVVFRVVEAVASHSWIQRYSPIALRVRVPNGFRFPFAPVDHSCLGLLHPEAFPDSPRLPAAQYPHSHSPLLPLTSLNCSLDSDDLFVSRALTVTVTDQNNNGLLPHVLYAFRLRVINPLFDKVWDLDWTLETVDYDGAIREQCAMRAASSTIASRASVVSVSDIDVVAESDGASATTQATAGEDAPLPLPARRISVSFDIPFESLKTGYDGNFSVEARAPPGFAFLRDCTGNMESLDADGPWKLIGCHGYTATATMTFQLRGDAAALQFVLQPRSPALLRDGQPLGWGLRSIGSHAASEASGLVNLPLREMRSATLQPFVAPYFAATATKQHAVLTIVPSTMVPEGGFVQVVTPRHVSFTFDADEPCESLREHPGVLGTFVDTATRQQDTSSGVSDGCDSSCLWPSMSDCSVLSLGAKLLLQVSQALEAGQEYCFHIRTEGPTTGTAIELPVGVTSRKRRHTGVLDVAPLVVNDNGQGWGAAPYVRQAAHLSLCSVSRVRSAEPSEIVIQMMPSSLGATQSLSKLVGRICLYEATLAIDELGGDVCKILEPNVSEAACDAQSENGCSPSCVIVRGPVFVSFQRLVLAVMAHIPPGVFPRADLQISEGESGMLLQGDTSLLRLPVLDPLTGITLTGSRTASSSVSFPMSLRVDWTEIRARFLDALIEAEQEEPSYLDVEPPPGIRISLTCRPVACVRVVPDTSTPRPGMRFILDTPSGPGLSVIGTQGVLDIDLFVLAATELPADDVANKWGVILRGRSLNALGAIVLRGFGIARTMEVRIEASSARAGDVFSRFVIDFRLQSDLAAGDVIVIYSPSTTIPCRVELAEPETFVTTAADFKDVPGTSDASCALELLQPLSAGVQYSINVPLRNPILTPYPNTWFLQAFERRRVDTSMGEFFSSSDTRWAPHSVAEGDGFEVAGEFDDLRILSKSSFPEVFVPTAILFKLRTPLPEVSEEQPGPMPKKPVVKLRLQILRGNSPPHVAFDPNTCLLDIIASPVLVQEASGAELLMADDCLVLDNGATVDFMFAENLGSRRSYVLWTSMKNPTAVAARDPTFVYTALTLAAGGLGVHRISLRPEPLLSVRASVFPGSYAVGVRHRAVVLISEGHTILGQRGSIELVLPLGFLGTCDEDDFRPRPALPPTARCREHAATSRSGARIVVYWRTLLGSSQLSPPYEFSFGLTNAGDTTRPDGTEGAWHIRLYEGDNQEVPVDATLELGFRPFELCAPLNMTMRREDARVISVVFQAVDELPAAFHNVIRVEILTSSRAPGTAMCPDTSMWQRRVDIEGHLATTVQGMPTYTECVSEDSGKAPLEYLEDAGQHRSAVLFLLPFARFTVAEPYGLEVILDRSPEVLSLISDSAAERAAEMLSLSLEAGGHRVCCASTPLGPPPGSSQGGTDVVNDGSNGQASGSTAATATG